MPLIYPVSFLGTGPPQGNLWGWWDAQHAYTETAGTPSTLITADGTAIGSLFDRSGNGRHVYQATGAQKPTYKTPIINGLASARFATASNQRLATNAVIPTVPVTMYIVANPATWGTTRAFVATDNGTPSFGMLQHAGVSPEIGLFNGNYGALDATFATLGANHLLAGIVTASTSRLRVDNNGDNTGAVPGGGAGAALQIGCVATTPGIDADIAEVLIYAADHSTFTSGDGLLVRQFLNTKYNLGLGI